MHQKKKNTNPADTLKELDSGKWSQMSLTGLYNQELMLQKKIDIVQGVGNVPMLVQMTRSMALLQEYIKEKTKDDPNPRVTVIMR